MDDEVEVIKACAYGAVDRLVIISKELTSTQRRLRKVAHLLDETLNGNGTPGMKMRMDRIERELENWRLHAKILWSFLSGLILTVIGLILDRVFK